MNEYIFELMVERFEDNKIDAKIYFSIYDLVYKWYYRIFVRGRCALTGCDRHIGRDECLPEGCYEWWCERCSADGINEQVNTLDCFYGDEKVKNFFEALKGN